VEGAAAVQVTRLPAFSQGPAQTVMATPPSQRPRRCLFPSPVSHPGSAAVLQILSGDDGDGEMCNLENDYGEQRALPTRAASPATGATRTKRMKLDGDHGLFNEMLLGMSQDAGARPNPASEHADSDDAALPASEDVAFRPVQPPSNGNASVDGNMAFHNDKQPTADQQQTDMDLCLPGACSTLAATVASCSR
jgi:hypothetical protein